MKPVAGEPRTHSAVNAGRSPAAIVLVGLLGLAGLVYMLWPKPPAVEQLDASAAGSAWTIEGDRAALRGPTMGTSFTVIVPAPPDHAALAELHAQIDAELAAVNAEMSTYLPDSELSRFNAIGPDEPFAASAHLLEVMAMARDVGRASGHAFDVSVGPLVDAWGFGPDGAVARVPSEAELAALGERVGPDVVVLDLDAGTLRKTAAGARVDLSAIAKGHGCDRVAAILDAAGLDRYLVEIGGELRLRGQNPEGEPWRVAVERPAADAGSAQVVHTMLRLTDVAVATSGGYRNYRERDGVRYSHTIDPRTRRPITHRLASVTVIDPDSAARADAWATALDVLGPEEGLAQADAHGVAAYVLVRTDAGFEARHSAAFAPYL